MTEPRATTALASRFRGFQPVIVDVETGGFNADTDALLQIAAVIIEMDPDGLIYPSVTHSVHVQPFDGAHLDPKSLAITGIDPFHPLRPALPEAEALARLFSPIRQAIRHNACSRAILVGHNAHFDLRFLQAAVARTGQTCSPFHAFSTLDTVSLAGLAYGQTVLSRACQAAGIPFDGSAAHSASYDAERTAELFCNIINRWKALGGWPG